MFLHFHLNINYGKTAVCRSLLELAIFFPENDVFSSALTHKPYL